MNQNTSQEGSSSCQCLTTLCGEKKKMQRNVTVILMKLRIMSAEFVAAIGHSSIWTRKEMERNLRLQTRWILGQNCRKNAGGFRRNQFSGTLWYQCHGDEMRRCAFSRAARQAFIHESTTQRKTQGLTHNLWNTASVLPLISREQ